MGRRRGPKAPPPKPFDGAWAGIDLLENNVMHAMVDAPFDAERVVRWLYPDEIVDKLKAAYPFVRGPDRSSTIHERLTLPVVFPAVVCGFFIKTEPLRMLVPEQGHASDNTARNAAIMATLRQVYEQHLQFEKVRQVTRWLNKNCTVGAARHYCPWLTGVLPADHPFHSASGIAYREPYASMASIMPVMRECGAIMASALMCATPAIAKNAVSVQFNGMRDSEEYHSNFFGLL